ncbi:unnamed protein product, partial [Mesorhabditis belari]|uniref:Pyrroline-5-carboxylate reductase n=1 Tax=Mesorhabditis belari TaxID=2138241 RepID=A0AAF3FFG3_9BILA
METLSKICESEESIEPMLIFLGGGNMATALVDGAVKKGFVQKEQIAVTARSEVTLNKWRNKGYMHLSMNNREVLKKFPKALVFIAVKPQARLELFDQIRPLTQVCISLMAGVNLKVLDQELSGCDSSSHQPENPPLLRLHPNIASSIGAGASIISAQPSVSPIVLRVVRSFAECTGLCLPVDEETFDAAGTLAGCTPAWAFTMIEGLSDGGVLSGVPRYLSTQLVAQAVMGAAKLVLESGEHPGALKDKVCSPGGTTIAGIQQLEARGVRSGFIEAVRAANERAKAMTKKE